MDELELNGRRHISAKRAAKEHRYHSDYIGQLIRSNKVIGQKVGRSWYVDAASLDAYLKGEEQPVIAPASAATPAPSATPTPSPEPLAPEAPIEDAQPSASVAEPAVQTASNVSDMRTVPAARAPEAVSETVARISLASTPASAPQGLRFVPDEEPIAPVRTMPRAVPIQREEEEEMAPAPQHERSRGGYFAIATAGAAVLVLVFATSYVLVHRTTVTGEQATAAVSVSFN